MNNDQLPEPTPDVLAAFEAVLDRCDVAWRISGGKFRIKPRRPLPAEDSELIQHYGLAFKRWVLAGRPSIASHPTLDPTCCHVCGNSDTDRHVYQVDRAGELIVVCVPCGAAWTWGSGEPLTSRERVFLTRSSKQRRRSA